MPSTALIPQCGFALGLVPIVGFDMAKRFGALYSVRLRSGHFLNIPPTRSTTT
jgi:hypothetical protein